MAQMKTSLTKLYSDDCYTLWSSGDTAAPQAGRVCVSFSSRKLPSPVVFGAPLFEKLGVPAFYIQPRTNDWYQGLSMARVIEIIREKAGTNRLLTYGSSMGGFGAICFAQDLGADLCIAISPQVSISRDIVGGFEPRWEEEAASVTFTRADVRPSLAASGIHYLMIYDPHHGLDRRHVDMIAASHESAQFSHFPVRLGGHPATYALAFGSVLSGLLGSQLTELVPLPLALRQARLRYRKSPVRKYVIALGLDILARRRKKHTKWASDLGARYPVAGMKMNLVSLRSLVAGETKS